MNTLKNMIQLIGNLGKAPEIHETERGKKLVRFSLATNQSYPNQNGEKVTEIQWYNLIAWGDIAEISIKNLSKGADVTIEGLLINRNYTDSQGVKRYITEIQVHEIQRLGQKRFS